MARSARLARFIAVAASAALAATAAGQDTAARDALAKETEVYCDSTASTKATPQMIIDKVNKACALVEKEGKASFPKFMGKDSEFIFAGTYIWINSMDGLMLMHPIKNKMEGKDLLGYQDKDGKRLFVDFIETCKTKGEGWVDYWWPKPGEKEPIKKISFVKKAMCDGQEVVVGCGVYDMTMEDVLKALGK